MLFRYSCLLAALIPAFALAVPADPAALPIRTFLFRQTTELTGLPRQPVKVWVPIPPSNREQTVARWKEMPGDFSGDAREGVWQQHLVH